MPLVAERNHTQKGGGGFFSGDFGAIFGVLWVGFALLVAAAGKRTGFSLFLGPGAAGRRRHENRTAVAFWGRFCSSLWPSLGQVASAGQPPHRRGRVSPDKRVLPLPWRWSHPTSTSQPWWGGWVVGSGGKRSTPQVLFFSARLLYITKKSSSKKFLLLQSRNQHKAGYDASRLSRVTSPSCE